MEKKNLEEYVLVRDESSRVIGKKLVKSKTPMENVAAYLVNGTLIYSFGAFKEMQDLAKNVPLILD